MMKEKYKPFTRENLLTQLNLYMFEKTEKNECKTELCSGLDESYRQSEHVVKRINIYLYKRT